MNYSEELATSRQALADEQRTSATLGATVKARMEDLAELRNKLSTEIDGRKAAEEELNRVQNILATVTAERDNEHKERIKNAQGCIMKSADLADVTDERNRLKTELATLRNKLVAEELNHVQNSLADMTRERNFYKKSWEQSSAEAIATKAERDRWRPYAQDLEKALAAEQEENILLAEKMEEITCVIRKYQSSIYGNLPSHVKREIEAALDAGEQAAPVDCRSCKGTGKVDPDGICGQRTVTCERCGGTGKAEHSAITVLREVLTFCENYGVTAPDDVWQRWQARAKERT